MKPILQEDLDTGRSIEMAGKERRAAKKAEENRSNDSSLSTDRNASRGGMTHEQ